jgi:glycosyltransferase involved in cell wall biosynthesis
MPDPIVSAVIPAYNGERFLRQAIDSALAQTYPSIEVIVIDDGSTDGTPEILSGYGRSIRVFRQENAGQAAARNFGIARSAGQWIAFLDQDDLWDPRKIETQLSMAQDVDALICSDAQVIDGTGTVLRTRMVSENASPSPTLRDLIVSNTVMAVTVLARREAVEAVGGFDPTNRLGTEDFQLWLRLAARGYRFRFLNQVLASYRWHGDNMSSNRARTAKGVIYALTKTRQEYPNAFGGAERRACRRAPSQLEHDRAWHLYNRGEYGEASRCFWRSVRLWPFSAKSWLYAIATSLPLRRILLPKVRGLLRAGTREHN